MIAELSFSVTEPVGINRDWKPGAKRIFRSKVAREFSARVKDAAFYARLNCKAWPRDPFVPAHVRLTVQIFDTAHDVGACTKATKDACQNVLYANDRIVEDGASKLTIRDGRGRRVEVIAELLAVRSLDDALKVRARADKAKVARFLRKIRV